MKFAKLCLFVFLLTTYYILHTTYIYAQVPPPTVDCSDTAYPEFNSLRPYQASPCDTKLKDDTALFCGDSLIVGDKVTKNRSGADYCEDLGSGAERCYFTQTQTKTVKIDLSDVSLPIMGRTEEDVLNSQNQNETLKDADKVNEYVSWYLNGTINRAEYPFIDIQNPDDLDKVVNFSGPINKLLSWESQAMARIEAINQSGQTRHNEVVACTTILGVPVPCYDSIFSGLTTKKIQLSGWPKPPLRENFDNFSDYWKAFKEWRGQTCLSFTVPIINKKAMLCVNNFLKPDYWGNLFSYIPPSSTEDRLGEVSIKDTNVTPKSSDVEIKDVKVNPISPRTSTSAVLYFSHMEESSQLADILQDTFTAKGSAKKAGVAIPWVSGKCDLTNVRSNPGDDLFAGEIGANVSYTAKFSCVFGVPSSNACRVCQGTRCIPTGNSPCDPLQDECLSNDDCPIAGDTCKKDISIILNVETKTPKADEAWSRLVSGPSSIFKRIAPKIDNSGPIQCLADIPASSKVTYTGASATNGELYFPHIGGISEYFLKGIQTFLRPKGYGEQIVSGQNCNQMTCSSGKIGDIPPLNGGCSINTSGSYGSIPNLGNLPTLISILETAGAKFGVPPPLLLGIMYGEGAFNPGKYDWTEENVRNWSMGCASMPNCTPGSWPSTGAIPFFEDYWNNIKDAVNTVDPKREPNPCNLLDMVFALAKDMQKSQNGSGAFTGKTCYGIALNAGGGGSSTCNWEDSSDIETAIRVWEFGTAYSSTYTCATKPGSCASGGGSAASCPGGDFCEKAGGSGNTSHNACVWNVAHSY